MAPLERLSSGRNACVTLSKPKRLTARCCFDHVEIAQIIVDGDAGIVDDKRRGILPRRQPAWICEALVTSNVQGCDAPVKVEEGLARPGVHPLRASLQCFLDQRFFLYRDLAPVHKRTALFAIVIISSHQI